MYSFVSLLSVIYLFPAMHSLLVTIICYKLLTIHHGVNITYFISSKNISGIRLIRAQLKIELSKFEQK